MEELKMKRMKYTIFNLLILTTALLSSCDSILEDEFNISSEPQQIEVRFARNSMNSSSSSAVSGKLIFWKNSFNDFFVTSIDDLTKYSNDKYNTGEVYPNENAQVYATGYSPADMQANEDFKDLRLSDVDAGITDVCVAEKAISGSRITPFNETMTFEHTLTKVLFTVERDQTMVGIRDVKNIKLSIPKKYLPIEWNWDETGKKYNINYGKTANKSELEFIHSDIISGTNTDELGTAYLMLPTNNIGILESIHLSADIYLTNSTSIERTINSTLDIQLYEKDNTEKVTNAKPGEAYEVRILFQQNSFILIARQLDNWEQGGLIYVPVKP